VRLAHRFAMENELISADCIESSEFPDLAGQYRVFAVPKTVINESDSLEGALPEEFFLDEILKTLDTAGGSEPATQ
jgi:thioredoxin family protein